MAYQSQLQPYIGIGAGEYSDNNSSDGIAILILLLSLAGNVLCIVWAFKAKSALQHYALMEFKFELKMNAFYTFLFSVFYITYCINAMPEALQKHNIIHGSRPLSEERHAE
ncbi:hypothetical protein [Budvicia aquatica]|uniref:DUF4234 domain-containing protein n=1 Tax=Budvicia aquatica TaxID=82979 RepID=A0A484ZBN1_9GAMM|nr:hypothetical protein [Budvicia aquatica]VFS45156.1 Uncharacterised protein [Budvicia aquatica]